MADVNPLHDAPRNPAAEHTIVHVRTHPKVLVPPFSISLVLIAAMVAAGKYLPDFGSQTSGTRSPGSYVEPGVYGLLLLAICWLSITPIIRWRNATYTVTTRRVRMHAGVLYKTSRDIPLDRITQVSVDRGILDRIFRCGTLQIFDAANTNGIQFRDVPRVIAVKDTIDEARFRLSVAPAANPTP